MNTCVIMQSLTFVCQENPCTYIDSEGNEFTGGKGLVTVTDKFYGVLSRFLPMYTCTVAGSIWR